MRKFLKFRKNQKIRDKYAETFLNINDFVFPIFVVNGRKIKKEIKNFFGIYHYSIDVLLKEIEFLLKRKISKILLFGVIEKNLKDKIGSIAFSEKKENVIINAIKEIKKEFPQVTVFADVCLCGYTENGHCGIFKKGKIDNLLTIKYLSKIAVNFAKFGADYVAPSAMMDNQVRFIREELDKNNLKNTKIMAYSAKYASNLYGPFRIAAKSKPAFGDRKSYQMDFRNIKQAINEIEQDIKEGADIIMIKPANYYLDVIREAKKNFPQEQLAAYQVSGEYMMIKLLAKKGLAEEKELVLESLTGIKRAGADIIISYFIKEVAQWLKG